VHFGSGLFPEPKIRYWATINPTTNKVGMRGWSKTDFENVLGMSQSTFNFESMTFVIHSCQSESELESGGCPSQQQTPTGQSVPGKVVRFRNE